MIKEDPENLINIINGDTEQLSNNVGLSSDFYNLKRKFDGGINKEYLKPSSEQLKEFKKEFENEFKETKITSDQTDMLIKDEMEKRDKLKIDKIFTDEEIQDKNKFKGIFNEKFDDNKNMNIQNSQNNETSTEIEPANNMICNYVVGCGVGAMIGTNTSITNISEAFEPIKVNNKRKEQNITYDELILQREDQDTLFKNPKLNKN